MNHPAIKVDDIVLLKRNTWHYKFRHRPSCRFFNNSNIKHLPIVRISRIANYWLRGLWIGKIFWFSKICNCFPAVHIHKIKRNGKIKIIAKKTSCPIQLEYCELFNKTAK